MERNKIETDEEINTDPMKLPAARIAQVKKQLKLIHPGTLFVCLGYGTTFKVEKDKFGETIRFRGYMDNPGTRIDLNKHYNIRYRMDWSGTYEKGIYFVDAESSIAKLNIEEIKTKVNKKKIII